LAVYEVTESAPNLRRRKLPLLIARHAFSFAGAAFGALLLAASPSHAQTATIAPNQLVQSQGIVVLNQAAGDANQEGNSFFTATGQGLLTFSQFSNAPVTASARTNASIGANVGANANGVVQITQAAGSGNLLANAVFIGIDLTTAQPLNGLELSQTRITGGPTIFDGNTFNGHATMAPSAFAGANGTIQVAQVAGNNNVVSNAVQVRVGP
jgi:hypothetical protein